jgi:hypothetical protein
MTQLHSKEIGRTQWKFIVWTPIILGALLFAVFGSSFFIPSEHLRYVIIIWAGGILTGVGFGLAASKKWTVEGLR